MPTQVIGQGGADITLSNMGPMTTTFTPPISCGTISLDAEITLTSGVLQVEGVYGGVCAPNTIGANPGPQYNNNCYPTSLLSAYDTAIMQMPMYSPGLVCPKGYTTACTMTHGQTESMMINGRFGIVSMKPDETLAQCCPVGYGCLRGANYCMATAFPKDAVVISYAADCSSSAPWVSSNLESLEAKTVLMDAWAMFLVQSTKTTHSSTSVHHSTKTHTTISKTAKATHTQQPTNTSSPGLSVGAKVAIGVVFPIVILAALLLGYYLYSRKQRRKAQLASIGQKYSTDGSEDGKAELEGTIGENAHKGDASQVFTKAELSPDHLTELDPSHTRSELPAPPQTYELASW